MVRQIKPVKNNVEKYETYKINMSKYNLAMKNEFYFEALIIDYALLEDRLRSFIYHIGLFNNRQSYKMDCGKSKSYILQMVEEYKRKSEGKNIKIDNITGKIKVVRSTLLWAQNAKDVSKQDVYLYTLKKKYDVALDVPALLDCLDNIEHWCKYRDEVVHALMNKNYENLSEQIKDKVEEGQRLAKYLDSQVRNLKKNDTIRKSLNLPLN